MLAALGILTGASIADDEAGSARVSAERGLAFLAAQQHDDGTWNGPAGGYTGVIGTCLLAFLAHGHVPRSGPYGPVLGRAIDHLLAHQDPDGLLWVHGDAPIYQHGLATLALSEVFGESRDPRLGLALQRAVALICRVQNHRGGWRHLPTTQDGDEVASSVVQLMALRSAHNIGMSVPPEVIDAGLNYVRRCQTRVINGGDGGFTYSIGSRESNWPRTGAGLSALMLGGDYHDGGIREGLEFLMRFTPVGPRAVTEEWYWHFGAWYVTLAFYQAQGRGAWEADCWRRFYPAMVSYVTKAQQDSGRWKGSYEPFPTAAHLLVLSFPCNYLPIHQR